MLDPVYKSFSLLCLLRKYFKILTFGRNSQGLAEIVSHPLFFSLQEHHEINLESGGHEKQILIVTFIHTSFNCH
jgi:hypothetical protein